MDMENCRACRRLAGWLTRSSTYNKYLPEEKNSHSVSIAQISMENIVAGGLVWLVNGGLLSAAIASEVCHLQGVNNKTHNNIN